ncbi:MAG: ABC transporter ATP-binding protein [Phycisphaerae bacterium]|jgi:ABC-2 type transport system ATP-binding protein
MAETNGAVVATRRLTKVFRDFWLREKVTAVADLNLDIRPGEVFGLLGPNGSGKSTTIKMILGLLFPTRGTISVFGRLPTDVAIKSRIGFLPEESYLYPFLDARETLDFYGRLFRQPRRQRHRRIDMLLEMVGLGSVAYRRVGEYSKGMQRRIGLAQALINDPDLLILDEPTSGMDPIGTRQFKDLIETLGLRGKTVILSSHLLADVEDVCDRVCILYGGRQRAEGDIADLLVRRGLTQITTQQLDEPTLEALRRQLAAAGKTIVDVTSPHDKLESLFLRIVQEAQDQRLATGGALAGGRMAEFLRGQAPEGRGEKILQQLVAAAEVSPPAAGAAPQAPSSAPSPSQTRQSVLEELLGKDKDQGRGPGQGRGKKTPPSQEP